MNTTKPDTTAVDDPGNLTSATAPAHTSTDYGSDSEDESIAKASNAAVVGTVGLTFEQSPGRLFAATKEPVLHPLGKPNKWQTGLYVVPGESQYDPPQYYHISAKAG